ncbi:hypothetical protein ACXZ1K_07990 [Pedobacter sp. PWIIR3]
MFGLEIVPRFLMTRFTLLILTAILLVACKNKKSVEKNTVLNTSKEAVTHTDTLQFVAFDGNAGYWISTFLNSKNDTVSFVTDSAISEHLKDRLFKVSWFSDTLYEAGDNDRKYTANRLSHLRLLKGKPFNAAEVIAAPATEAQIIKDLKNIPEVQSGADQVGIAERPAKGKAYYLIETGTHGEDNFSRFLMFRVYVHPNYEIKVYDPANDIELTLEEWRKLNK